MLLFLLIYAAAPEIIAIIMITNKTINTLPINGNFFDFFLSLSFFLISLLKFSFDSFSLSDDVVFVEDALRGNIFIIRFI